MSRLEDALLAGRPAITAEMPTIDGGGVAEVERKLEPLRRHQARTFERFSWSIALARFTVAEASAA